MLTFHKNKKKLHAHRSLAKFLAAEIKHPVGIKPPTFWGMKPQQIDNVGLANNHKC